MRRRIQQLAGGTFENAGPDLSFSTDKTEIEVLEGKDMTGDFVITSTNHVPMKGVVYTSDARMECLTPQFEGEEVRIRYQFHSEGLVEGDIQKGEFFIICNQGEYNLSFVASVTRLYAESSLGKIKNLNDFAKLARSSFKEAYRLFYSPHFKNLIKAGEVQELLLYEGLSRGKALSQKVDEFLVGIHKKKKTELALQKAEAEFYSVTEERKEEIELKRSQWGYLEIEVTSDAAFLVPEKEGLTQEDFIGSTCKLSYYIREEALHAGKNFGCISFITPGNELRFTVCASRNENTGKKQITRHREEKEGRIRLLKLYMDYRLKKTVTGVWASQSVEILDHLMAMQPEHTLYPLMKAQALIINRQRQEAAWIMEEFKRGCQDRFSPEWGYYLYLCTLVEREPSFVDKTAAQIEEIFHKNPESSLLFWILLFVKEEYYRNSSKRLKAIEQWMKRGGRSPYFYLEAYYLIWQDPYLLGRLDTFETEVLGWARKQEAISRDIALQVMNLVPGKREFDRLIYRILEECYRVYPEEEMLSVICAYLIKGQCFGVEYHKWYAQGIEHELRITSLYEAYLMSMDGREVGAIPRTIQLYFRYNNSLSYQQRAVLFVNIIAGKATQPEVYQKYRRTMEQFAMEQMEAGHMNDNLAVVYDEMLRVGFLNEELARKFAGILFVHKLTCQDRLAARAVVWQKQLKKPQEVPIVNGTAYFQVYTDDYCVMIEDSFGQVFTGSVLYQEEALMNPETYIADCLRLAPKELRYILYDFRRKRSWEDFTEQDSRCFPLLLKSERISEKYKTELIPEIIRYYQKNEYDKTGGTVHLEKYLSRLELECLAPEERRYLTELLAEIHMYEKAYQTVQLLGYDYLSGTARVSLCSYAITECDFEEDDFLLGFAENTFVSGKYNDILLIYLCKYYNGPSKTMAKLWKAAEEFQIDTFELEERLLMQMLYTTEYIPYVEQIYESYYAGGGKELVCLAYLSYFAHSFVTRDAVIPEHVFLQIEERYLQGKELNDACNIGLLKVLSEKERLREGEYRAADELLSEYTGKNIYFAFYRRFGRKLTARYHLYDKFFAEYHTAPGRQVWISYRRGEEAYQKEILPEMYEGIYVKEFVLFFGESIQYYVTEEEKEGQKVTESNSVSNHDILENENQGRYAMLNEILLELALLDPEKLQHAMKNYYGMQSVTQEVFRLL